MLARTASEELSSCHSATWGCPMFVELDARHGDGLTVTLEWDRGTGHTQIVVHDTRSDGLIAFGVPPVNAADAFRHPFR